MLILTEGEVLAAMCIWEELLTSDKLTSAGHEAYHNYREDNGACETRDRVLTLGRQCEAAGYFAREHLNFDAPFDWEFVPLYVALCIDEDFTPKYKTAEQAARALMAAGKI